MKKQANILRVTIVVFRKLIQALFSISFYTVITKKTFLKSFVFSYTFDTILILLRIFSFLSTVFFVMCYTIFGEVLIV